MSDGLLPDDEAPIGRVTTYKEPSWTYRANLTLTDAFREFVQRYGEGDDVGEAGTGGYTGSTGKKRRSRAIPLLQNIELQSSEITEDDADDPGEGG
ncbi:hypothetical protein E4U11_007394 [Claviceps purpurea]|nr:hypothetical protein E4U11_007394 [Claviceps purpurea]